MTLKERYEDLKLELKEAYDENRVLQRKIMDLQSALILEKEKVAKFLFKRLEKHKI